MHKFSPENFHFLQNEERKRILPARETLISFGLRDAMTMVDIGAGPGYFTVPASAIVGDKGKVYAIDIQEEMIKELTKNPLPHNIVAILSQDDYRFPVNDEISDFTLIAFVTHENEDLHRFYNEIKRITKNTGRIVILEWKKQHEEFGPPYKERLAERTLEKRLKGFGIEIIEHGEMNKSHYKIICTKK